MPAAPDTDVIALRIKAAQDQVGQIQPITSESSAFELSHAYEVARRIHESRLAEGAVPVGRKIGFTNSNIWPQYDVHAPIWGYIYDTTVVHARGGRAKCGLGAFAEPRIEPEIVVHFAKAPPANGDAAAILRCIDWVAHAFEIVQSHFPGWCFQAADTVADSALHGALVVGEPLPIAGLGEDPIGTLESFSVKLSRDGDPLEVGKGSNVLGGPLSAVAYLIETLAGQPQYPPLQADDMVTTGTLTAAYPARPGERWASEFDGIPLSGLAVEFEM